MRKSINLKLNRFGKRLLIASQAMRLNEVLEISAAE
jgi:hypothetical protein